jgi:hypothetical protein
MRIHLMPVRRQVIGNMHKNPAGLGIIKPALRRGFHLRAIGHLPKHFPVHKHLSQGKDQVGVAAAQ